MIRPTRPERGPTRPWTSSRCAPCSRTWWWSRPTKWQKLSPSRAGSPSMGYFSTPTGLRSRPNPNPPWPKSPNFCNRSRTLPFTLSDIRIMPAVSSTISISPGTEPRRSRAALSNQYGIAADRLTPNGVAYLAPVASNATDEGRGQKPARGAGPTLIFPPIKRKNRQPYFQRLAVFFFGHHRRCETPEKYPGSPAIPQVVTLREELPPLRVSPTAEVNRSYKLSSPEFCEYAEMA